MSPAPRTLLLCALGLSGGCTRVLQLQTDDSDPASAGICVPAQADGYRLPSARWGLAAAHASRRLDDDPDDGIALSPAFFLATGWQATGFGCAEYGPPWTPLPDAMGDPGCLAIEQGTVWHELTVLYPGVYPNDAAWEGALAGDAPEASALTLAWGTVASHALWGRAEVQQEPASFYAQTDSPRAVETLSAWMHVGGPWSSEVVDALQRCPDALSDCLGDVSGPHVRGVLDKVQILEAAPCYDQPLTPDDVDAHVDALARLWPDEPWQEARPAAQEALESASNKGFRVQSQAVLDALDTHLITRLSCPEQTLWSVYRYSCP